ncbi:unnamed protein product [Vicia faba]|uniref:Inositol polyphosphate-related phosphatase domain-containing protein n=1 Tax=Vicia faba TaxID=3906 RepID=A0AAV0ZBB3_VICFA|nr:unnamed protein product [Vicia faba]
MELKNQNSRYKRLCNWFTAKQKENKPSQSLYKIEDGEENESDEYEENISLQSLEFDSCISTNNLRIFVGSWNVAGRSPIGSLAVDLDEWLNLKNSADIYVLGFQEIVPLKTLTVIGAEDSSVATNWNNLIGRTLSNDQNYYKKIGGNNNRNYKMVASKKMVGVFIIACGVMGCLGNKGCVAVSMLIEGTSFCFVVAHLASGEKKGDEGRRNHQVEEIFRRTYFLRTSKHHQHPLTILGHDRIFWLGDLNYRLYLKDHLARHLIRKHDWKGLQEFDQLQKELEEGGVFEGWKEGNIEFAPTYKYASSTSNIYCGGGLPTRSGEKQRTPAWCDRILWYGKGIEQLHYIRSESKFSDHRPVSALFSTQIEIKSSIRELVEFDHDPSTILHPNHVARKGEEDENSTSLSLLMKNVQG